MVGIGVVAEVLFVVEGNVLGAVDVVLSVVCTERIETGIVVGTVFCVVDVSVDVVSRVKIYFVVVLDGIDAVVGVGLNESYDELVD